MKPPKDIDANFRYRAQLLHRAERDTALQSALRSMCAEDPVFWLNTFGWTFDPRPENQKALGYNDANLLFLTWEFQDEFIRWLAGKIERGGDGVLEKSRDMGASWLVLVVFQWFWQFGGAGNDFKLGSRKEEFVDKIGDMDALFPKIRYQLKRQPWWLLPKGFRVSEHAKFMNIINPVTGSAITGESNNPYFGTGGRRKAVLFDEFAKWTNTDESAWQSASDVTGCKIAVSSANGRGNHFYRLRAGEAGEVEVYRMHWRLHPLKDQAWYDREKTRRSKQDLAAEVDIDYAASVRHRAWDPFNWDTHVTDEDLYDPGKEIILACDFNIQPMSWVLIHEAPPHSLVFDELVNMDRTRTEHHIEEFVTRYKYHELKVIHLYGDASGKSGSTSSKRSNYDIIEEVLRREKWEVISHVPMGNPPQSTRLNASNKRLEDWEADNRSFVTFGSRCKHLINSLEQTQRKGDGIDKDGGVEHAGDAWSYYECKRHPIQTRRVTSKQLAGF